MKKIFFIKNIESGQILPIIVVSLLALIGLSALIIDGGALMVNRRAAQNAADAGALAGARILCGEGNPTSAAVGNAVYEYTETLNGAEVVDWYITTENVGKTTGLTRGEVIVTAELGFDFTFFSSIFSNQSLKATATAGAGCAPFGPSVVIPIIYPCNPPVEGSDNPDCDYKMLKKNDVTSLANAAGCGVTLPINDPQTLTAAQTTCISNALYAVYSEYIYIIVNSDKFCAENPKEPDPTNEIICELSDTEGRYQLNSSARGWLNLDDGNGSVTTLTNWINGTNKVTSSVHTWHSIVTGTKMGQIWDALSDRTGHIVWVPIINELCDDNPEDKPSCFVDAHVDFPLSVGQTCDVVEGSPAQEFGHIIAFAPFMTTCVRKHNSNFDCPGYNRAVEVNPELGSPPVPASMEGYFLYPDFLIGDFSSIGGADLGIYRAFLTR